jgi:hypothetical protein
MPSMLRHWLRVILPILLLAGLAAALFSDFFHSPAAPAFLQTVTREIQAASQDAGTQWMVVVCLLSYFIVFLVLKRRILPQRGTEGTKEAQAEPCPGGFSGNGFARFVLFCGQSSDVWLCAFVFLVLFRYALDYANAAKSLQVVVLLTGLVFGKAVATWARFASLKSKVQSPKSKQVGGSPLPAVGGASVLASRLVGSLAPPSGDPSSGCATFSPSDAEKGSGAHGVPRPTRNPQLSTINKAASPSSIFHPRSAIILCTLTLLLASAALCHPARGMEFFYRGQTRWTGPWDNPNLYGLLMGVGTVLAVGLLVASCRLQVAGCKSPVSCISRLKILFQILLFSAAGMCAYGLIKSYSRGAWLGTAVGLGFLIWKFFNREIHQTHQTHEPEDLGETPLPGVGQAFQPAGAPGFPVRGSERATGKSPAPADRNVRSTREVQSEIPPNAGSHFEPLNRESVGAPASAPALGMHRSKAGGDAGASVHGESRPPRTDAHRGHEPPPMARQRLGLRQSSGAFDNPRPSKRQRAAALQDLAVVPTVHGEGDGAHGVTRPTFQLSCVSWLRRNRFPLSVLLISVFVLCFWQFRHTESPLLRRVFSVGNPNDFSWRNRVAAWQGAGRMMLDQPLLGFGWGTAEEIYSKEYRPARLEESAAIQMNDYLMLGISAGPPALLCLLVYVGLVLRPCRVGRGSPLPAVGGASVLASQLGGSLTRLKQAGAHGVTCPTSDLQPATTAVSVGLHTSDFGLQTFAVAAAGALVLLIGFWFDGGLFKLPTAVVFWTLLELARRADIPVCRCGRLSSRRVQASGAGEHGTGKSHAPAGWKTCPTAVALRWCAGIAAAFALGFTALHLIIPQLTVSERTLSLARRFLVPPGEKNDFDFLAGKTIWANQPLKSLLQHAHLANYNRALVNWKLDDQIYREYVLSPVLNFQPSTFNPQPSEALNWRRPLWEFFYPRIRKESSLEAAAEIVLRQLRQQVPVASEGHGGGTILECWQRGRASEWELDCLSVAALRSVGIPARFARERAEFWNGSEWRPTSTPAVTLRRRGVVATGAGLTSESTHRKVSIRMRVGSATPSSSRAAFL